MPRPFFTSYRPKELIPVLSANFANRTVFNFWKPGYKIERPYTDGEGRQGKIKVFVPTSTKEEAVAFLRKEYSSEKFGKFKKDIHPGHCSVETNRHYLSVGVLSGLEGVSTGAQGDITYTESFVEDVFALQRVPDLRLDFYTLNAVLIDDAIKQFKIPEQLYNRLSRNALTFPDGEDCAITSHLCLRAGGIEALLRSYPHGMSYQTLPTPSSLFEHVLAAREAEFTMSEESFVFSREFKRESQELMEKLCPVLEEHFLASMQPAKIEDMPVRKTADELCKSPATVSVNKVGGSPVFDSGQQALNYARTLHKNKNYKVALQALTQVQEQYPSWEKAVRSCRGVVSKALLDQEETLSRLKITKR